MPEAYRARFPVMSCLSEETHFPACSFAGGDCHGTCPESTGDLEYTAQNRIITTQKPAGRRVLMYAGAYCAACDYFLCLIFMNRSGACSPTRATAWKMFSIWRGLPLRRTRQRVFTGTPPEVSRQRFWTRGLERISLT